MINVHFIIFSNQVNYNNILLRQWYIGNSKFMLLVDTVVEVGLSKIQTAQRLGLLSYCHRHSLIITLIRKFKLRPNFTTYLSLHCQVSYTNRIRKTCWFRNRRKIPWEQKYLGNKELKISDKKCLCTILFFSS